MNITLNMGVKGDVLMLPKLMELLLCLHSVVQIERQGESPWHISSFNIQKCVGLDKLLQKYRCLQQQIPVSGDSHLMVVYMYVIQSV